MSMTCVVPEWNLFTARHDLNRSWATYVPNIQETLLYVLLLILVSHKEIRSSSGEQRYKIYSTPTSINRYVLQ